MNLRILLLTYPPTMAPDQFAQLKADARALEDRARAEGERLFVLVQPEGVRMSSDAPALREGSVNVADLEAALQQLTSNGWTRA